MIFGFQISSLLHFLFSHNYVSVKVTSHFTYIYEIYFSSLVQTIKLFLSLFLTKNVYTMQDRTWSNITIYTQKKYRKYFFSFRLLVDFIALLPSSYSHLKIPFILLKKIRKKTRSKSYVFIVQNM